MLDHILNDIILIVTTLYIIIVLVKSFEEFIITVKLFKTLSHMGSKKRGKLHGRVTAEPRNKRRTK